MHKLAIYNKMFQIANLVKQKGGSYQSALSLIKNNPFILELDIKELEKRLYLIINANTVYAAIYVEKDDCSWSILQNNVFSAFKNSTKNEDYIIEMLLTSIDKYLSHTKYEMTNQNTEQTLEQKITNYNIIKKNEDGYHLK